jgi:hypothetical protein
MAKIKITLRGAGGELDSRVVEGDDPFVDCQVNKAIEDLSLDTLFSVGDTITIEEIEG